MAVVAPGLKGGLRAFNGAGGPAGIDFSSIFYRATKGVPRYEDLLSIRALSLTHTISVPLDTIMGQVTTTPWAIVPTVDKPTTKHLSACEEIEAFLDGGFNPNPSTFDSLCKEWLNDIECIDAGVLELVPGEDGWLQEIYARDGATFTKNTDAAGRLPTPGSDEPAYWQVGAQAGSIAGSTLWDATGLPRRDSLTQNLWSVGMLGYRPIDPIPFSRDQIVWVEQHPTTWRAYGFSPVQKVQRLVEILLNQDISNLKYFPTNEIPEGVLNLAETAGDDLKRFREYWKEEIVGKPHKLALLNAKTVQWIPFRATPQELEFLQSQEWYNNLVWMCFGLSANEVGYVQDVNRSTAQEQAEAVWRRTTVPLLELLAGAINRSILPFLEAYWDVQGEIEFRWDPDNPILRRQKRAEQREDLRLGLTTPNKILQESGSDPVPWGDIPYDVYQSIARTQPEWFLSEILGMDNAPEPVYGAGFLSSPDPLTKAAEDIQKGRAEEEPPEWRSRIETLTRKVSATLADELAPLKEALEVAWPAEVPDDGLPVVDVQRIVDQVSVADALLQTTDDARVEAMQHGADIESRRLEGELEKRVGGGMIVRLRPLQKGRRVKKFDVRETIAYRLIRERGARNMRHVNQTVQDRVRDTLTRVIADGGNVNDAWLALQETIDGLTADHARVIARTEIMGAQRYGKQALAESIPDIAGGKGWHSRKLKGRTRPWHDAMDNKVVPVSESFVVPATGAKGQPRDYPKRAFVVGEDQPFNCMCDQRIVLKEDLPTDATGLRSIRCLSVSSPPSPRQQEVLAKHGETGETVRELLERMEHAMSKNQTAATLGISKATLYEWRKSEGLE